MVQRGGRNEAEAVQGWRSAGLSRRVVLGGLGAGAGFFLLGPAVYAAADGGSVRVEPLGEDVAFIPTGAGSLVGIPHQLGARLLASEGRPGGLVVRVDFDPRMYTLGAAPVLGSDEGAVLACRWKRLRDGAVQVMVDDALPANVGCSLILGRCVLASFPADVVPDPRETLFKIRGERAMGSQQGRAFATREESVWGMSAGVGWREVRWGGGVSELGTGVGHAGFGWARAGACGREADGPVGLAFDQ